MLTGRVTTPDNQELNVNTPWANAGQVVQTFNGHQITIEWEQPLNSTSIGPRWNLHAANGTLRNMANTPRSRPPAPMLPPLA